MSLSQSPVPRSLQAQINLTSQINNLNHGQQVVTSGFLQLTSLFIPVLAPRPFRVKLHLRLRQFLPFDEIVVFSFYRTLPQSNILSSVAVFFLVFAVQDAF